MNFSQKHGTNVRKQRRTPAVWSIAAWQWPIKNMIAAPTTCNNNNSSNNMASNGKCPTAFIRQQWLKTKQKDRKNFDSDNVVHEKIRSFLDVLMADNDHCHDIYNQSTSTSCSCLHQLGNRLSDDEKDQVAAFILKFYTINDKKERQQYCVTCFKYAAASIPPSSGCLWVYLLPGVHGSHSICRNALNAWIWKRQLDCYQKFGDG